VEDIESAALSSLDTAGASIALYPAGFSWLRPLDSLLEILRARAALTELSGVETLEDEVIEGLAPFVVDTKAENPTLPVRSIAFRIPALQTLLQEALVYKEDVQPNVALFTTEPRVCTVESSRERNEAVLRVVEDSREELSALDDPTIEVETRKKPGGGNSVLITLSIEDFDELMTSQKHQLVRALQEHDDPVVEGLASAILEEFDDLAKAGKEWEVGVALTDAQIKELAALAAVETASVHELSRLDAVITNECAIWKGSVADKRAEFYKMFRSNLSEALSSGEQFPVFSTAREFMDGVLDEVRDQCGSRPSVCAGQQFAKEVGVGDIRGLDELAFFPPVWKGAPYELRPLSVREEICSITLGGDPFCKPFQPRQYEGACPLFHPNGYVSAGSVPQGVRDGTLSYDFSVFPNLRELVVEGVSDVAAIAPATFESAPKLERLVVGNLPMRTVLSKSKKEDLKLPLHTPTLKKSLRELELRNLREITHVLLDGHKKLERLSVLDTSARVVELENLPMLKRKRFVRTNTAYALLKNLPMTRRLVLAERSGQSPLMLDIENVGTELPGYALAGGIMVGFPQSNFSQPTTVIQRTLSGLASAKAKITIDLSGTLLATAANFESQRKALFRSVDTENQKRAKSGLGKVELLGITRPPSTTGCGDGLIQTGEDCDSENLGKFACKDLGFAKGVLRCNWNCKFDTFRCEGGAAEQQRRKTSIYTCQAPTMGVSAGAPTAQKKAPTQRAALPPTPCKPASDDLDAAIANPAGVCELRLAGQPIEVLPEDIDALGHLKILDLTATGLESLPPEIGNLPNLEKLFLRKNNISELPEEVKKLKKLNTLDLRLNSIDEGERARLRKLLPNTTIQF
jgi:hypothetical protein